MELLGLVTFREVAHMVRMGEMVGRAATAIETMLADSAQDPSTTETLLRTGCSKWSAWCS